MSQSEDVLKLIRRLGVLRTKDLDEQGIPRTCLTRLYRAGILDRPSRGVYVLKDADMTEHQDLAAACRRVPHGVVCLLSALQFHELTTQIPHEVWLAIDRKARLPKVDYPPLRIVRFSGRGLTAQVESHKADGVTLRVTSPARTVVDCFAYRNKIGLDVGLEALRDCLRKRRATRDELFRAAEIRRMKNVIRPYLEAVSA